MATVTQITTMCKNGQVQEAYALAQEDLSQQLPWAQREVGWALYYLIKLDVETGNYQSLLTHLDELTSLDQLTMLGDRMIFENILFKVASFIKEHISPQSMDSPAKLSSIFSMLRGYTFDASKGYSFLLQNCIKCDNWQEMADFLDWWDLDRLTEEDYTPYRMNNGKSIMSVAERAFIAKSKALLRLGDKGRIEEFLPKMDDLMNAHPEMTYPGYFYGKLLLALGNNHDEALKVIVPFARKKATEFWVWQLLSDVFTDDPIKQLACLMRAVNCRTQETFLGKVRIKLAAFYIRCEQFDYAKFQIDKVTQCYLSQGWNLPYEIRTWMNDPWFGTASAQDNVSIDYKSISDSILCEGTEEAIAIVTYVDSNSQKATLIYGYEKRMAQRFRFKVGAGAVLKINYITEPNGQPRVLSAGKTQFPANLNYAKVVSGIIKKRPNKDFAFLKTNGEDIFVAPNIVSRYNLSDGEQVKSLVVYDYNRKKNLWDWTCISINR